MTRFLLSTALAALLLAAPGCASVPADLDLGMRHATTRDAFVVELEPPAAPPAVNRIHSWRIKLTDASGAPVTGARIAVDGGMPQHGHGFPTQPRVTREESAGIYLLEGMKFSMTGWWEIRLRIEAENTSDTVTFNTVLGSATAAR